MSDLAPVFEQLRQIMLEHADRLTVLADEDERLSLETSHVLDNGKNLWFGGVEVKKKYVSYHLMPVYMNPALVEDHSPELRKRMQGKSCFNFRTVDSGLFEELASLTASCVEDFERKGYL